MGINDSVANPCFQLANLHIRNLRGIERLDLPRDGMGWDNGFPPVAVLGGANGSGKTTLLACIAQACQILVSQPAAMPFAVSAEECLLDFLILDGENETHTIRFLVGNTSFVDDFKTDWCFGYSVNGNKTKAIPSEKLGEIRKILKNPNRFSGTRLPRLVFLPSDNRDLVIPSVRSKIPRSGVLEDTAGFVAWLEKTGERQWDGSTLELFYAARWADLNAKEEGKADEAVEFDRFTRAFDNLTNGRKRLGWTPKGALVVRLDNGQSHSLKHLSSGERQALFLLAELERLWRPGSLILIDELELHLHDAWQGALYEAVRRMQSRLGGQVILTTQSHSLFSMAELGTRALLGRGGLR